MQSYINNCKQMQQNTKHCKHNKKIQNKIKKQNIAKKCKSALDHDDETNKPVTLLAAALAKLEHEKMHTEVETQENKNCLELCEKISGKAIELKDGFDHNRMRLQQLSRMKN